jgi:hypothetical protein
MTKKDEFEYTVLAVYETQGSLVVEIEHEYGKQKIGLSANAKYLGNDGQPRWKKEIASKMQKKYGNRNVDKSLPVVKVFKEEVGKKHKIVIGDDSK